MQTVFKRSHFRFRFIDKPTDLWGIDWENVPSGAWNERFVKSSHRRIGKYDIAYLRLTVTVLNGRAGDSMLFLLNQPNTTTGSGLHAAVHVEIGAEGNQPTSGTPSVQLGNHAVRRATAVEQHLIRGWDVGRYDDGQDALDRMKSMTEVRFMGLSKEKNLEVHASCVLLGGMF